MEQQIRVKNDVSSKETYICDRAPDNMMHFVIVIITVVLEFIHANCV